MTSIGLETIGSFQAENRSWMIGTHGAEETPSITLDVSAFTANTHYPNGFIPSGTPLGKITASGLYAPYAGTTDEVQTVTEGGSGLTSFTLTYSGQTTGSIAAAATAATVQTALEALSNIAVGDVTVTGSTSGPYTVTFGGALADTNVAQMTATPTGGTGTVTVATQTAGGADAASDGTEVCGCLLFSSVKVPTTGDVAGAGLVHGSVSLSRLPFALDANGQADLRLVHFSA